MEEFIRKRKKISKCCMSCRTIKSEMKGCLDRAAELTQEVRQLSNEQLLIKYDVKAIGDMRETLTKELINLHRATLENANLRMRIRRLEEEINQLIPVDSSPNVKYDPEDIKIRFDKFIEEGQFLRKSLLTHCWNCGIKIKDYSKFDKQHIKNGNMDKILPLIPAVPIEEVEYYICKKDCYNK